MGEIETIEHTRDKSFGVSVFKGKKRGNASSSDFSLEAIDSAIRAALDIAKYTAADKFAGLPDEENISKRHRDLDLYHPWNLSTGKAVEKALAMEQAAFDVSKHIRNSDGANVSTESGHFYAANSKGFKGGYPYSRHSLSVSPIARRPRSQKTAPCSVTSGIPPSAKPKTWPSPQKLVPTRHNVPWLAWVPSPLWQFPPPLHRKPNGPWDRCATEFQLLCPAAT